MSMVTSSRPAPCRTSVTAAHRRRALRFLLKPMSCCGILGKKSKRSSPDGCETPSPSSWGCAAGAAAATSSGLLAGADFADPAVHPSAAASSASSCLPPSVSPSRSSVYPQKLTSAGAVGGASATVAAFAVPTALHPEERPGDGGGALLLARAHQNSQQRALVAGTVGVAAADVVAGHTAAGASPAAAFVTGPSLVKPCDKALLPSSAGAPERGHGAGVQLMAAEELVALLGVGGGSDGDGESGAATVIAAVSLLDCRAFMSYNHDHIRGAINVSCTNKCTQKRMRGGHVCDFITSSDGKELFRSSARVVVYDDKTADLGSMTDALSVLVSAVLRESKAVHVLKGGMDRFREQFHNLCATSTLPTAVTSTSDHKDPISGQLTLPRSSPHAASRSEALDEVAMNEANGSTSLMECPPSAILSFLYIGNESDASNLDSLKQLGVTHVLNATTHAPCTYEHSGLPLKYKRLPVKDTMQQNMQPFFNEANQFIEDARFSGGRVLVHCHAGVSRSATLAIAYLLSRSRLTTLEAYEYVKQRRHVISPNINFMGQLLEYEKSLSSSGAKRSEDSLQLDPV